MTNLSDLDRTDIQEAIDTLFRYDDEHMLKADAAADIDLRNKHYYKATVNRRLAHKLADVLQRHKDD
jgi:hypothetical protein